MAVQKIDYPNDARVETGAVQFGNDWPGLFIRGDRAMQLGMTINQVVNTIGLLKKGDGTLDKSMLAYLNSPMVLGQLTGLRDTIQKEVLVKFQDPEED